MPNRSAGNQTQDKLAQAIASGLLPSQAAERAQQLMARLQQPVRLGILGRPGSGKSALLNLLVGREVLPDDVPLPTTQVSYGEKASAICTLPNGSKQQLDTANAYDISGLKPLFVELRMPLPALKKISVLEVVTPNDPNAIHKASQWAAKRCELAIWCTETFDTSEQTIWGQMPDVLKDHAFLMLTKADLLRSKGTLEQILEATRALVGHEFNDILPIATLEAIAARRLDGSVDKEQMRQSGGSALISSVLRQVDQGRQSDIDMADVLLHQNAKVLNGMAAPDADNAFVQSIIGAAVNKSRDHEPEPAPEIASEPETVEPTPEPVAAEPEVAPAPPEPEVSADTPAPANAGLLQPATREAYEHAVNYITEQGRALATLADTLGDEAPAQIMAETSEHVQWVCDYLNENGDDGDTALHRIRDAAFDAADLVQLMQMEKRDSAAIEAVSIMLQIKHELQADLAA